MEKLKGACLIIFILFSACASPSSPSRFYVLSPIPQVEQSHTQQVKGVAIGVGPIELPEHLNRPHLVWRSSSNEVKISEFHQWAEPLEVNFARVLSENLSILLATDRIAAYPWKGSTPIDYQVTVEATRFDSTESGVSHLNVRWTVLGKYGRDVLIMKKSSYQEAAADASHSAIVQAMNRNLEKFSRDVAATLKQMSQGPALRRPS